MWAKVKTVAATVWADFCDTWKRIKVFAIAVGAAILYFEWEKVKAALILYAGKKEIQSDQKQDQVLAQKEASDNQQADALVQKAQNEKNPGDDWYENK
jgi:hypothetical protein